MNRGRIALERERRREAIDASMRPRFMNRGRRGEASGPGGPPRRFNEAPIHESGKDDGFDGITITPMGRLQ